MIKDTPAVAIDFDGTLAEYDHWRGPDHVGEPRKNAVWALECFKLNGWEIEIFTCRSVKEPIWRWVETYAPGTVDRVNETRHTPKDDFGRDSPKPRVDLFIDDRSWETFGEDLSWEKVMKTLDAKGLFPEGLKPLPNN